jgi:hypothetical protein
MPPDLIKSHQKLADAVDAAYGKKKFSGNAEREAFLFELYQQLTTSIELPQEQRRKQKQVSS